MKLSPCVTIMQTDTDLEYLAIESEHCSATIFLQGAQLASFIPKNKPPLIWMSQDEDYQQGKGLRGGIPICWPWFGVSKNQDWPIHGVARTNLWRAEEVNEHAEYTEVILSLPMAQIDKTYWPYKSALKVVFHLSDVLKVTLINTNLDSQPIELTQALHTYFPTSDITATKVDGLQGSQFIEFGEGPFVQNDVVGFARETDMVYTQVGSMQHINTPEGTIAVERENSTSCVLWNPWIDKAKRLSNFADDEYKTMLCLEAGNVMDDKVVLAPGESHSLSTIVYWV